MHNFVECDKFVFISTSSNDSQTSSMNGLSILHNFDNFVTTVTILHEQRLIVFFLIILNSNCPRQYRYVPNEDVCKVYFYQIFFLKP